MPVGEAGRWLVRDRKSDARVVTEDDGSARSVTEGRLASYRDNSGRLGLRHLLGWRRSCADLLRVLLGPGLLECHVNGPLLESSGVVSPGQPFLGRAQLRA